jgi:hypothetical protein
VWEQIKELGRFAAVGDEEKRVALEREGGVSSLVTRWTACDFLKEGFSNDFNLRLEYLPNHHAQLHRRA